MTTVCVVLDISCVPYLTTVCAIPDKSVCRTLLFVSELQYDITTPPPQPTHPHQGGGLNPRVSGGDDIPNSMVYHPSYDETRCRTLRDKAGPIRDFLKRATGLGLFLPLYTHDVSKEACPSYHIKGL